MSATGTRPARSKFVGQSEARLRIRRAQRAGERVVFTNGCFDVLHVGHVRSLEEARGLGDRLIVAVNRDASVRGLKGPDRPLVPERQPPSSKPGSVQSRPSAPLVGTRTRTGAFDASSVTRGRPPPKSEYSIAVSETAPPGSRGSEPSAV